MPTCSECSEHLALLEMKKRVEEVLDHWQFLLSGYDIDVDEYNRLDQCFEELSKCTM